MIIFFGICLNNPIIESKSIIITYPRIKVDFPRQFRLRSPFIRKFYEINFEQGYIFFEGKFHYKSIKTILDETPIAYRKHISKNKNDYLYLPCIGMMTHKPIEKLAKYYLINIYDMEYIEDTSVFWYDEDVCGNICLTPTAKMKIFFTILEEFNKYNDANNKLEECLDKNMDEIILAEGK